MKPRAIQSYKILAVAITAGVGCTTPEQPRPEATPQAQQALPTPSAVASGATPSTAASSAPSAQAAAGPEHAPPPPDDKVDPKLLELRSRLELAGKDGALANEKTFRPLCDAEGYPLVGNLQRKSPTQPFGPTAFCAEVRSKKKRS